MKNTKNAFTLVELIVVITILAVLATVAFISLTGYSQEAKNSKVTADLRTLVSALETSMTKGDVSVKTAIEQDATLRTDHTVSGGITFNSGSTSGAASAGGTYDIGTVDFAALKQNGDDFVDADGNKYLYAYVASGSVAQYQVVGQVKEASGDFTAIVKGNYVEINDSDTDGLVADESGTYATSGSGVTNDANLGTNGLY